MALQDQLIKVVSDARIDRDLTLDQLADMSGLSATAISAMLRGDRSGYLASWQCLLDVLDIEIGFRKRRSTK